jgi:inner membrane protein
MDPITHLALGACLGASCAPRGARRRGALLGAVLGELPDIDVVALHWLDDPVMRLSYHRSATHSLIVLPIVALLVWLVLRRTWPTVREEPRRWLVACLAALLSHPLLDAFTVYGTQLFWPLDLPPVMLGSIFVIDPLFTLPLLVGALVALFARDARRVAWWTRMGLAFAVVYLAWTQIAKHQLESAVRADLEAHQLVDAKILIQPAPLQSLLWRSLVVRRDGTWFDGYYSYLVGNPLTMDIHPSTPELLKEIEHTRDVERLKWFTQGYYSVDSDGDHVVMTDLRMGMAPDFIFRYEVADYDKDGNVVAREPAGLKPWPRVTRETIARVWQYLFAPPTQAP